MSPPFVPKVRGWEDTRYFDDGEYPTDHDDESTDSEAELSKDEKAQHDGNGKSGQSAKKYLDPDSRPTGKDEKDCEAANPPAKKKKKKNKETKRPRDKILRDRRLRKTALEMRKKGAFLGYTYRRPKGVIMALTPERGRPFISRGQLSELYG